jgi:hypothetical protein
MSVCGYHAYMGEGLQRFSEGLRLALQEKAKRKGRDMGQHMSYEADEIAILRAFLETRVAESSGRGDQPESVGFLGIVYICHFLMADPARLAGNPQQLGPEIESNVRRLVDFLIEFEDAFEESPDKISASAKTNFAWDRASKIERRDAPAGDAAALTRKRRIG